MPAFFRYQGTVFNAVGVAIAGGQVWVYTQPNSINLQNPTTPPTPLATLSADANGTALANPVIVDGNGNFFFYAAPGFYTLVFFDPYNRIPTTAFPDIQVVGSVGAGGGTVTSVALTVPAEFTVGGSPVTGAGTLAITKNSQNANLVYAGPTTGVAAAPTFRSLVAADFPAGLFPPTGLQNVAFSATPVFDASLFSSFAMTLTGNVTSSTLINGTAGQTVTFLIQQDGAGGRTFTWPANVFGAGVVIPDPGVTSVQEFIYTGTVWKATGVLVGF